MTPKKDEGSLSEKRSIREIERRRSNREAILHAAEAVICRKGMNAASMDDVAAEAGFSKATLYKYVRSKSELVFELMIHFLEDLDVRLKEIVGGPLKPEAKLLALLREVFRYQAEKDNLYRAFIVDRSLFRMVHVFVDDKGNPGTEAARVFFRRMLAARRAITGQVETFLRKGVAAGVFRPMSLASATFFLRAVIQGYQHDQFFRESKPDLEKDVLDIHGYILRGIKAE
ncbi:MAG: helix-turn-helix domain containing protein [Candidatus Aminicenantes bacterium]|nr:helix-turn-helix domain containing protein [Candidatus Aminicenantes bacterium]